MRTIDWELNDGFPLDQGTMQFLQDESYDRIMAFITYWQHSVEENHFIICGMEHNKNNNTISAGWCWISNKLLYYPGGAYPGDGCVIRPVLTETEVEYEDGIDRPSLKYWRASIVIGGTGEGLLFGIAKRVPKILPHTWENLTGIPEDLVYDTNYHHTDNNFTNLLLEKLDGIADGAEVNVQSDWNQTDQNHDSFIKNKPTDMMRPQVVGTAKISLATEPGVNPQAIATGDIFSVASTSYNGYGITVTITHPTVENGLPVFYISEGGTTPSITCQMDYIVTEKTNNTLKLYFALARFRPYIFNINLTILK